MTPPAHIPSGLFPRFFRYYFYPAKKAFPSLAGAFLHSPSVDDFRVDLYVFLLPSNFNPPLHLCPRFDFILSELSPVDVYLFFDQLPNFFC